VNSWICYLTVTSFMVISINDSWETSFHHLRVTIDDNTNNELVDLIAA